MGAASCCSASGAEAPSAYQSSYGDEQKSDGAHVTYGSYSKGGKGEFQNQDSVMMVSKVGGIQSAHLFAVFDGHGTMGKEISSFLRSNFPTCLTQDPSWPRKPQIALRNAASTVNDRLKASGIDAVHAGSTGCICLLMDDTIYTCNTGDSRAIAGTLNGSHIRPMQLTTDHTVKNSSERQRILNCGGRIVGDRIYCAHSDEPGLIPSRAYGDFNGAPAGITCDPELNTHDIGDTIRFIVIMSDGVWENVASSKITSLMMNSRSSNEAARGMVEEAKRVIISGKRYKDDMTAVIVQLHNYGIPEAPAHRSRRASASKIKDNMDPVTDDEMVMQSVMVCREAMDQGVHADDVLDHLVGLTDEMRENVKAQLDVISKANQKAAENKARRASDQRKSNEKKRVDSRRGSDVESAQRGGQVSRPKNMYRRRTVLEDEK